MFSPFPPSFLNHDSDNQFLNIRVCVGLRPVWYRQSAIFVCLFVGWFFRTTGVLRPHGNPMAGSRRSKLLRKIE